MILSNLVELIDKYKEYKKRFERIENEIEGCEIQIKDSIMYKEKALFEKERTQIKLKELEEELSHYLK